MEASPIESMALSSSFERILDMQENAKNPIIISILDVIRGAIEQDKVEDVAKLSTMTTFLYALLNIGRAKDPKKIESFKISLLLNTGIKISFIQEEFKTNLEEE